jgi:hypothetical protein
MDSQATPIYPKVEEWTNTGTQPIMIFYPTMEEISNFSELIKQIEKKGAHLSSGIAKVYIFCSRSLCIMIIMHKIYIYRLFPQRAGNPG